MPSSTPSTSSRRQPERGSAGAPNERLVGHRCAAPEERAARDPAPMWRNRRVFEPIHDVVCRRGWFALIESPRERGWVATANIRTATFDRDGRSLITGCDAFTWS